MISNRVAECKGHLTRFVSEASKITKGVFDTADKTPTPNTPEVLDALHAYSTCRSALVECSDTVQWVHEQIGLHMFDAMAEYVELLVSAMVQDRTPERVHAAVSKIAEYMHRTDQIILAQQVAVEDFEEAHPQLLGKIRSIVADYPDLRDHAPSELGDRPPPCYGALRAGKLQAVGQYESLVLDLQFSAPVKAQELMVHMKASEFRKTLKDALSFVRRHATNGYFN